MQENLERAREFFELGLSQFKSTQFFEAEQSFNQALLHCPNRLSILINLSATLLELGKWDECKNICHKILSIEPDNFDGHLNLSTSIVRAGKKEEALLHLNKALEINPLSNKAWVNKGNILLDLNKLSDSSECFTQALKINPKSQEALIGRGNFYNEEKKYDLAIADFNKALEINPSNAIAQWNKSLSLIRLGDFNEGWKLYESRWQVPGIKEFKRKFDVPLWLGKESLKNKVILIHHEQGYGDTIQFCRYIPILESMGAKIYFLSPRPLSKLIASVSSNIEVIEDLTNDFSTVIEKIDYYCPIMSLAYALGTTIETIPTKTPYLAPTQDKLASWGKQLEARSPENNLSKKPFRIGIAWKGSGHYAGLKNPKRDISEGQIAELINHFANADIEFHSLQFEEERNKELSLFLHEHSRFIAHDSNIRDFNDTAALITHMNLIVSVDTATAHLAGALNKATIILIPDPPDFMSLTSGDLSPWYPRVTLLRQNKRGDWGNPLHLLKKKISEIYYGK